MTEWNYGNAHQRFPVEENEIWVVDGGKGKLKVHDIYNPLPDFMLEADMIIVDPPWNLSNINTFYTKADKKGEHTATYDQFCRQLFAQIDVIAPRVLYIEMGKQNIKKIISEAQKRFTQVEVWDVTYYKKHPCHFVRASNSGKSKIDYTGMDEWDAILAALAVEDYDVVADLCMGQGLVGIGAYQNGKKFVGTELNKKRLAVLIEKIAKMGGIWEVIA